MCAKLDVLDMLITKEQLYGMYEMGMADVGGIEEILSKLKAAQGETQVHVRWLEST